MLGFRPIAAPNVFVIIYVFTFEAGGVVILAVPVRQITYAVD